MIESLLAWNVLQGKYTLGDNKVIIWTTYQEVILMLQGKKYYWIRVKSVEGYIPIYYSQVGITVVEYIEKLDDVEYQTVFI